MYFEFASPYSRTPSKKDCWWSFAWLTTPFLGLQQIIRRDKLYRSQQRFGMYRWHLLDPIHFQTDLRVDMQALGWKSRQRYQPLHDDIASTAFFYLDRPSVPRPPLPGADDLDVGS
jgi:hypothetical protein